MANFQIELEWYRYSKGYRLVERSSFPASSRATGDMIVPNGGDRIPCPPFDKFDTLYSEFSKVKTPDGLLQFVKNFGLLSGLDIGDESNPWGDSVPGCLKDAEHFRELLIHKQKGPRKLASFFDSQVRRRFAAVYRDIAEARKVGSDPSRWDQDRYLYRPVASIDLVPDPSRGVRLRIKADCLLAALWLQLAQKLSGDAILRECVYCHEWFETGPGKRRASAKFCSEEHKIRYFSLKRTSDKWRNGWVVT
jgi:hypothetical protein